MAVLRYKIGEAGAEVVKVFYFGPFVPFALHFVVVRRVLIAFVIALAVLVSPRVVVILYSVPLVAYLVRRKVAKLVVHPVADEGAFAWAFLFDPQ